MYKIVSKILIIQFIAVFILQLFCLILLISPSTSQATVIEFKPQIEIPGTEKELKKTTTGGFLVPQNTELIAKYIKIFYKYAIGIVGILAAVVLMFGGVIWLTAGGSAERIGQAKSYIASSLTGLLLALTSYLILATVNPALVNLNITRVGTVEQMKVPVTAQEMHAKCLAECKDIPGPYQYDPKTNTCECYGAGKHKECQVDYGPPRVDKCVEVPYAGIDTCSNDQSCRQKYGCCRCSWGVGLGTSFYTSCTASVNMKTTGDCRDYCGVYPDLQFVAGAICNSNKNCVLQ